MIKTLTVFITLIIATALNGQNTIKGKVIDDMSGEPLIGASVIISGTTEGTITDYDGFFEMETTIAPPWDITTSYIGYVDRTQNLATSTNDIIITLEEVSVNIDVVEVKASRISEETKKSPLTVESLDLLAVKETPSSNFYEGLGQLKGVDLTTASLGFQVINTRGFNSTSPVRSLQIIDGVDNQAPGLNFSLGNFLGSSELDILKVDLIVGASSAFYGPNAFNGVVSMTTKDPFLQKGLSASVKVGERNMLEGAFRWAQSFDNKNGDEVVGYKINASYLKADDWEATNYDAVYDTETRVDNPGGYDRVNSYGDEYTSNFDFSSVPLWKSIGVGVFHRRGYNEIDLVDYDTKNLKTNAALHFRLQPSKGVLSPEIIAATSYSQGTTVYQGDNRFSLKNIKFFQQRLELRKKDKFFIRAYMTRDNAGDSYDPYFTALQLQGQSKNSEQFRSAYTKYWTSNIEPMIKEMGYPKLEITIDPETGQVISTYDTEGAKKWLADHYDDLVKWHQEAQEVANMGDPAVPNFDFYEPGTDRFNELFNRIISTPSSDEGLGTKIVDRSALYHIHGEYNFKPQFLDYLKVGANYRLYTPESEGTVFVDTTDAVRNEIKTGEYGVYTGAQKSFNDSKLKLSATLRMDKNDNFDYLFSPAASVVWTPTDNNFLRLSFSSAIRNPTLTDQYLEFNVGRAILRGNLNGVQDLITLESFDDYRSNLDLTRLERFDIDPIKPESVKSFELGYRTTLFERLFVDASYYISQYTDFIGYNIGLDAQFTSSGLPSFIQAYRYSANSENQVRTQGFSAGLNYYINDYKISGNYSFNNLVKTVEDDPIIPAFNTPEHKYNIGLSSRNIRLGKSKTTFGFNVNYKWIQGFLFEGSPQFTGFIDSYGLLDAQVNFDMKKLNSNIKIGASNILDNQVYQTYGGPLVGRLAYIKYTYEFKTN